MLTELQKKLFADYAKEQLPKEACALLFTTVEGGYRMVFVPNTADDPVKRFRIEPSFWLHNRDLLAAVIHSHPTDPATPSPWDLDTCNNMCLPWVIYSLLDESWNVVQPVTTDDLLGQTFKYGERDCFTLIQKYYRTRLRIYIPSFSAPYGFWKKADGPDPYVDNFAKAGFVEVDRDTLKLHDVLLIKFASAKHNHGAVYSAPGQIMHHVEDSLSCTTAYGGYWLKHTAKVLRHFSLC